MSAVGLFTGHGNHIQVEATAWATLNALPQADREAVVSSIERALRPSATADRGNILTAGPWWILVDREPGAVRVRRVVRFAAQGEQVKDAADEVIRAA